MRVHIPRLENRTFTCLIPFLCTFNSDECIFPFTLSNFRPGLDGHCLRPSSDSNFIRHYRLALVIL